MSIGRPPDLPGLEGVPDPTAEYLIRVNDWLFDVYNKLKFIDLGNVKLTSSDAVPTGGEDGDMHVRVAAASTALYININGSWSAYTNP
jgi:DNA-binding beta-propeller fold protein YncE